MQHARRTSSRLPLGIVLGALCEHGVSTTGLTSARLRCSEFFLSSLRSASGRELGSTQRPGRSKDASRGSVRETRVEQARGARAQIAVSGILFDGSTARRAAIDVASGEVAEVFTPRRCRTKTRHPGWVELAVRHLETFVGARSVESVVSARRPCWARHAMAPAPSSQHGAST